MLCHLSCGLQVSAELPRKNVLDFHVLFLQRSTETTLGPNELTSIVLFPLHPQSPVKHRTSAFSERIWVLFLDHCAGYFLRLWADQSLTVQNASVTALYNTFAVSLGFYTRNSLSLISVSCVLTKLHFSIFTARANSRCARANTFSNRTPSFKLRPSKYSQYLHVRYFT